MGRISRRALLAGGAASAGAVALLLRPNDRSAQRETYFVQLQEALGKAGIATPTLVIDRARLDRNIDTLTRDLPSGMGYRIVAKSLPSPALLQHVRERSGSNRLMTFNLPMLASLTETMPDADQLLGKPLPVEAARRYFEMLRPARHEAADQVQWLIDTPERLNQYSRLAEAAGRRLRVNLELDVGLHRGGFEPGEALGAVLASIKAHPRLSFAGFMGYEPHVASLPEALGWRERVLDQAWRVYRGALAQAGEVFNEEEMKRVTRNAAGSPTYRCYRDTRIANEISAGSCLVKPTHFDTDLLAAHVAASFIAAPVIKSLRPTRLPGLGFADAVSRTWNPNYARTVFIYGGNWLAEPIDPPGLDYNAVFGRSSNQEMLNGGSRLNIAPDEFVFFRPQQSEAVFLQFGDIAVYDDGAIVDRWPVFPASA